MATTEQKGIPFTPTITASRQRLYRIIRGLPEGEFLADLSPRRKKATSGQRGYYWGYLVPEIGRCLGRDREAVNKILCGLFLAELWSVKGVAVRIVKSTADLAPSEMDSFCTKVRAYAWSEWRLNLALPGGQPY